MPWPIVGGSEAGSSELATITAQSEFDPGVSSSAQVITTAHPPPGWQVMKVEKMIR
jgi:hypothetical protein